MRFLLVLLFVCGNVGALDISAGLKKIADCTKYEVDSLELFVSPISLGWKFAIGPSWGNLYRRATGQLEATWTECKIVVSKPLIERYVTTVLLHCDEELCLYTNDPTPDPFYESNLRLLKRERLEILREELYIKYNIK